MQSPFFILNYNLFSISYLQLYALCAPLADDIT